MQRYRWLGEQEVPAETAVVFDIKGWRLEVQPHPDCRTCYGTGRIFRVVTLLDQATGKTSTQRTKTPCQCVEREKKRALEGNGDPVVLISSRSPDSNGRPTQIEEKIASLAAREERLAKERAEAMAPHLAAVAAAEEAARDPVAREAMWAGTVRHLSSLREDFAAQLQDVDSRLVAASRLLDQARLDLAPLKARIAEAEAGRDRAARVNRLRLQVVEKNLQILRHRLALRAVKPEPSAPGPEASA